MSDIILSVISICISITRISVLWVWELEHREARDLPKIVQQIFGSDRT